MSPKPKRPAAAAKANDLPHFKNPPVIEVVCGVTFHELPGLLTPHIGRLWERYRSDYPKCQEMPPLAHVIELGPPEHQEIALPEMLPMTRVWLIHGQETGIIQLQRDRFLHNWKKVRPQDEYPEYSRVIEMFGQHLTTFESFLTEERLGEVQPVQYEMTYVNHIPFDKVWSNLSQIAMVLPDFSWRSESERFLPAPELVNWRTSFLLPDSAGRLHVSARIGRRAIDQEPVLVLDLTARGFPRDATRSTMWQWFDLAHEWIVRGFTDITGERMRKSVWGQVR
jgi:uncharacterized protein (TIGR04255 family)